MASFSVLLLANYCDHTLYGDIPRGKTAPVAWHIRDTGIVERTDTPLGHDDERILLLPYVLTLGNRLLRNQPFPFLPAEILSLDRCRSLGDVEALDERG